MKSRLSYDRFKKQQRRQCIFIGTTNEDNYLIDDTGNRRFLPVKVGRIDVKSLKRDRDQLWAEAAFCEARGDQTWLPDELLKAAKAQQRERELTDEWEGPIVKYLGEVLAKPDAKNKRVTVLEVAQNSELVLEKARVDSGVQRECPLHEESWVESDTIFEW